MTLATEILREQVKRTKRWWMMAVASLVCNAVMVIACIVRKR